MSEISNNNEYIPRAERRNKDGLTEKEFLEQYNPGHYERPSVTVDMLLFGISPLQICHLIKGHMEYL